MEAKRADIVLRPLAPLTIADFQRLLSHYTTSQRYIVTQEVIQNQHHAETQKGATGGLPGKVSLSMELVQLDEPQQVTEWVPEQEDVDRYNDALSQGLSYGAYAKGEKEGGAEQMVGLVVAEHRKWNNTVWVWEVHVHKDWRGKGVGSRLMEALVDSARDKLKASMIVCETQALNVPAIGFYARQGFRFDGIDVSYYREDGLKQQDIAVFMKLPLLYS